MKIGMANLVIRKTCPAWGLDVGNSSLKAVRLAVSEGNLSVVERDAKYAVEYFLRKHTNKVFYLLNYSSDAGDHMSAVIECADVFSCVPHLEASHH